LSVSFVRRIYVCALLLKIFSLVHSFLLFKHYSNLVCFKPVAIWWTNILIYVSLEAGNNSLLLLFYRMYIKKRVKRVQRMFRISFSLKNCLFSCQLFIFFVEFLAYLPWKHKIKGSIFDFEIILSDWMFSVLFLLNVMQTMIIIKKLKH
jgi:hypothetical protein